MRLVFEFPPTCAIKPLPTIPLMTCLETWRTSLRYDLHALVGRSSCRIIARRVSLLHSRVSLLCAGKGVNTVLLRHHLFILHLNHLQPTRESACIDLVALRASALDFLLDGLNDGFNILPIAGFRGWRQGKRRGSGRKGSRGFAPSHTIRNVVMVIHGR